MSGERHAGLEDLRPGTGKLQFQASVDDSCLDETDTLFAHEEIADGHLHADHGSGQFLCHLFDVAQIHLVLEVGYLFGQTFKKINKYKHV